MIASNKEWEFAGLYADEGISGTRADKRPQFQKMIDDCHKGRIDMIITKSVSRFARNTVDCLDYVRSLKEIGVGIYFEEQNIDTLKSDSELYLVIYAGHIRRIRTIRIRKHQQEYHLDASKEF